MQITSAHPFAQRLARDPFDAFWLENLYDFRAHCTFHLAAEGETVLEIALNPIRLLRWLRCWATTGLRPFRILERPAVLHAATRTTDLDVIETVDALQTADSWIDCISSTEPTACTDLGPGPGLLAPTASLPLLAVKGCSDTHLKLSLSINAFAAVHTLPPKYLHNGILASICLKSLRPKDAWLQSDLLLCNKNQWGALWQGDKLESDSAELACLIRHDPALPRTKLIPMAALPITTINGNLPTFDHLLGDATHEVVACTPLWLLV